MRHILIVTTALVLTACGERADTSGSGTAGSGTGNSTGGTSSGAMNDSSDSGQTDTATRGEAGMGSQDTAGYGQTGMSQSSGSQGSSMQGSGMQGDAVPGSIGQGSTSQGSAGQGAGMGTGSQGGAMQGGGNQTGAMASNSPQTYVANAAMSDMYERETSQLALTTAKSPAVKAFARQMIADHTATSAEVKKIVGNASLGITPPAQLDSRRQGLVDNLRKATGGDFDRMYIQQQVAAHREALAVHRVFADAGTNAPLKAFAAKTAPKVQMHLEMVEKMGVTGR